MHLVLHCRGEGLHTLCAFMTILLLQVQQCISILSAPLSFYGGYASSFQFRHQNGYFHTFAFGTETVMYRILFSSNYLKGLIERFPGAPSSLEVCLLSNIFLDDYYLLTSDSPLPPRCGLSLGRALLSAGLFFTVTGHSSLIFLSLRLGGSQLKILTPSIWF